MDSSSNYTVTAPDGGLVCSARWSTYFAFAIGPDSRASGLATSDMIGDPVCTHPEFQTTPTTTITSSISGTATATELTLTFTPFSYLPDASIDSTGMSASLYGVGGPVSPTLTVPITSPGHAAGSQVLQTISSVNSYTSENTITLDCDSC